MPPARHCIVVALFCGFAGCGGSGTNYSPREQEAIEQAERFVERELNEETLAVHDVFVPDPELVIDYWRVELETVDGDRCVYMSGDESAGFDLESIKSGRVCGGDLLYP